MTKKLAQFTIKEKDLAAALEISHQRLREIIDFFDSDPNDEWELREDDHFVVINKQWNERLFSKHGAFAIAKYMDSIEKKSIWDQIVEFITKHKQKLRNAFVCQKIHENSSSLTKRNNRHYLSKKDTVNILCTSYAKLNKVFRDIQQSERPLAYGEDFDDIDGTRYYSLFGFFRISKILSQELTVKDRREWCSAIEIVGDRTFKQIISVEEARKKRIDSAKKKAKTRDKKTCQITQCKPEAHDKFNLAVHHIFSAKDYPHLESSIDNLITIREEIHKEFHTWNGGFKQPCTIDDLIRFVMEIYPAEYEILHKLNTLKVQLGTHTPVQGVQALPKSGKAA